MRGSLLILVGISGSGKTTYAHNLWRDFPEKYVIVTYDRVRSLLYGYRDKKLGDYFLRGDIRKLERGVYDYVDTLISKGLSEGKTVIVDNTNLKPSQLRHFKMWNVPTEVKVLDVSLEEALERNLRRDRVMFEVTIEAQWSQLISLSNELTSNPLDLEVEDFITNLDNDDCVVISEGMDEALFNKYYVKVITYPEIPKDNRPEWVVKEEFLREVSNDYNIIGVYDNNFKSVVRARALGLNVYNY